MDREFEIGIDFRAGQKCACPNYLSQAIDKSKLLGEKLK